MLGSCSWLGVYRPVLGYVEGIVSQRIEEGSVQRSMCLIESSKFQRSWWKVVDALWPLTALIAIEELQVLLDWGRWINVQASLFLGFVWTAGGPVCINLMDGLTANLLRRGSRHFLGFVNHVTMMMGWLTH